jgi:small-conductance mechanosensitive channel
MQITWHRFFEIFTTPLVTLGKTPVSLSTIAYFFVIIIAVMALSQLTRRVLRRRLLPHTRLDPTLREAAARYSGYVVLLLGFAVGFSTLGFDLTSLTVLAGAVGVGVGFGLQNIIENFISGLIILGEKPIQLGHRVEVNGTAGQVMRIGARSTSILTNDNITMIVPNSDFITKQVVNWSHGGDLRVRMHVPVGVSYGSDPHQVREILVAAARANPDVLEDPEPRVVFLAFGDSALEFELRVWTATMSQRPHAFRSSLLFEVWDRFKAAGIEIPFPQRDLHLRQPVEVRVAEAS